MPAYTNQSATFKITVITPLHIGGTTEKRWLPGLDYLFQGETLYVLDRNKVFESLPMEAVDRLSVDLAVGKADKVGEYLRQNSIRPADVSLKMYPMRNAPQDEIMSLIHDGNGTPYMPGSSLKGALRSVLWTQIIEGERIRANERSRNFQLEREVFGTIGENLMRFLQVGDAYFDPLETRLFRTKTFNLQNFRGDWEAGWKHAGRRTDRQFKPSGFVFTYETFDMGCQGEVRIGIKDGLKNFIERKRRNLLPPHTQYLIQSDPWGNLMQSINRHTEEHLKREFNFLIEYDQIAEYDEVTGIYEKLLDEELPQNRSDSCLIRLAAGSGFHSITGDWLFKDHDKTGRHERGRNQGAKRFKSRKFAFEKKEGVWQFYPMGIIRLDRIKSS